MEYHVYWLLESSCFELFKDEKYGLFLSQKVDGKMIFTDYWKFLVLNFSEMGNTVFFAPKRWWKDDIYWLLKSSCFKRFEYGKYGLFWAEKLMERLYLLITEKFLVWNFRLWEIEYFFSQKVDVRMIFSWSFLIFHDIPGLGKYGFSCSVKHFFKRKGLLSVVTILIKKTFDNFIIIL